MNALASATPQFALTTTTFVGRGDDLAQLRRLLSQPEVRLVTLFGPGGVGKTRLALQLMQDVANETTIETTETCLTLLSHATNADMALQAIAQALGIADGGSLPLEAAVANAIGLRSLLLVLDNVEQLVDALAMIPDWLAACPNLTIMVTSRVMLRLSAEHVFPVDPLSTQIERRDLSPAGELFLDRARAVHPALSQTAESIAAINEICQHLDGLPLAIELAAARTRFLSPMTLRDQLPTRLQTLGDGPRDAPERHRTLRATIAWSYDLLDDDEQRAFERIASFENGASLEAALAVANANNDLARDTKDVLASLADHSLLRFVDIGHNITRIRMLHTIREYAIERLQDRPEYPAIQRSFADWFATVVITTPATTWRTGTAELREWTTRHLPDLNNFRRSIQMLVDQGEPVVALDVAGCLALFWPEVGQLNEAQIWYAELMPHVDRAEPRAQAQFFRMACILGMKNARLGDAEEHGQRALAAALQTGDQRLIANNENMLAQVFWRLGHASEAERLQQKAIDRMVEDGDPMGGALFAAQIADNLIENGDLVRAESMLREAMPVVERHRPEALPLLHGSLGEIALLKGDLDDAGRYLERSLEYHQAPPHAQPAMLSMRLMSLAKLAMYREQSREAAWLMGAARALHGRSGAAFNSRERAEVEELIAQIDSHLTGSGVEEEMEAGTAMVNDMPRLLALAVAIARLRDEPASEPSAATDDLLTPRERDVLVLLAEGHSNAAIAERLFISQRTVTTHLSRLYAKLEVSTRTEAIAQAMRMGLIQHDQPA